MCSVTVIRSTVQCPQIDLFLMKASKEIKLDNTMTLAAVFLIHKKKKK